MPALWWRSILAGALDPAGVPQVRTPNLGDGGDNFPACVLENCPRRHRGLVSALAALQQDRAHRPVLIATTTRASETLRPPQAEQVGPARLLGRKPSLKLAQVPRVFLHRPPYYRLCQPESSK